MTEGQAKALVSLADKDDNGNIDFQEFHSLWNLVLGELEVQIMVRRITRF